MVVHTSMWSRRDLDELAVWADARQQAGDRWGELVATSLAHATSSTPELAEQLARLQHEVFQPAVAPLLSPPSVHPEWEHGVLVGLRVVGNLGDPPERRLAAARALLSLPCARFVWRVWISSAWPEHDEICRMLLDEQVVARPRVLRIGDPRLARRRLMLRDMTGPGLYGDLARSLAELERGLIDLTAHDGRFELHWAPGDGGSRLSAFRRLAARIERCEAGLPPLERTLLGRALQDRSLRVRLEAMELLEVLGAEAAMFVPMLVMQQVEDARWLSARDEVLLTIMKNPQLVARLVDHLAPEHYVILGWLERADALDDRALERVDLMLARRRELPGWLGMTLQTLLHRHRPPPLLPQPEAASRWFTRLRTWLRGE